MSIKSMFFLFLVLLCLAPHVSAYSSDDIEWESVKTVTLHWGDSYTVDNYVITADDFNKDGYAYITIYKDNIYMTAGALKLSDKLVYRDTAAGDDIKVFVSALSLKVDSWTGNLVDPYVKVQIYRRGLPDLEVTVDIEKDSYDPTRLSTPRYIEGNVTIKNVGDAEASNIVLSINTAGLELGDGKLTQTISSLKKGESGKPLTFSLEIPLLWDEEDFKIVAQTTAYDINSEKHTFNGTKTITIEPKSEIVLTKTYKKEIYMDDTAYISLILRNTGAYGLNSVLVNDPQTDDLELQGNVLTEKTISINAQESVTVLEYALKPIKPGKFTLPKATASFTVDGKKYTFESDAPVIQINGPYIVLEKKVNVSSFNPGDNVLVTVSMKNEGNRDANVKITETVPEGTSFVSGVMTFDDVVNDKSTQKYSYVLKLENEADMKLPATSAKFTDLEGYKGEKTSNVPVIKLKTSQSQETSQSGTKGSASSGTASASSGSETEVGQQPGFEAWSLVLALIAVMKLVKRD
ncbi:BatD family protein [uncultured Methanomethylovorans sp.]|uniref:BatD family protein n=1 Tax=uncultured Methanomethylovorans sp. TaxID=183759 RepID=UPI002AA828C4|nr:BatD family protein [uncultured Methanomethylovorans sp.]